MASSIVISCIVALSLTPVLCAMLLKNSHGQVKRRTPLSICMDAFNRWFERLTGRYVGLLRLIVTRRSITALLLGGFIAGTFFIQERQMTGRYLHVPGILVAVPSTPADAKGLLKAAIREDNPVVFIEHEYLYGQRGDVPDGEGATLDVQTMSGAIRVASR